MTNYKTEVIKLTEEDIMKEVEHIWGTEDKQSNDQCLVMVKNHECNCCCECDTCGLYGVSWLMDDYEVIEK